MISFVHDIIIATSYIKAHLNTKKKIFFGFNKFYYIQINLLFGMAQINIWINKYDRIWNNVIFVLNTLFVWTDVFGIRVIKLYGTNIINIS